MKMLAFTVSLLVLVGCASGQSRLQSLEGGETRADIIKKFGPPRESQEIEEGELLVYRWRDEDYYASTDSDFALLIAKDRVARMGKADRLRAMIENARIDRFFAKTPHEWCSEKKVIAKYGSMSECKADVERQQTELRAQLERREAQDRAMAGALLMGTMLNQPAIPAYKPIEINPPQLQLPQPAPAMNCRSVRIGNQVHTQCQ